MFRSENPTVDRVTFRETFIRSIEESIRIDHPAEEVYRFATDPTHLSAWIMAGDQTLRSVKGRLVKDIIMQ